MTVEYRSIRGDDEFAAHSFIEAYSFNEDRGPDGLRRRATWARRDWCIAAFDGDEMVAGLVLVPFEMYLNGARIPLGGISSVACLPERRRGGLVGGLLRDTLSRMRDAGQPLSALYTPHYSLYRRFGWAIASRIAGYSFPTKTLRLRLPRPSGRFRRIGLDDWRLLHDIYTQHAAARNGALARDEHWWRAEVIRERDPRDVAVWSNDAGESRGYAVYRQEHRPGAEGPHGEQVLRVYDRVALDADAHAATLAYLLTHDQAHRTVMWTSVDEPLADAFEEPYHLEQRGWFGIMLRLVDVQRALELRPALPQGSGRSLTVALTDDAAPWNAGTWRIACGEGRITAERTGAAPGLEMDVRALAAIYNGYVKPADAVRTGSVRAHDPEAIDAATQIFAVPYAPFCHDIF